MTPAHISTRVCSEPGCNLKHKARGLCHLHYARLPHIREAFRRHKRLRVKAGYDKIYFAEPIPSIRRKANAAVNNAIASGRLKRCQCEICGKSPSQAHHDSYHPERWLDVRWLCAAHHREWHKLNRPAFPIVVPSCTRSPRVCSIDGCDRKHFGCGACRKHHAQLPHVKRARSSRRARLNSPQAS